MNGEKKKIHEDIFIYSKSFLTYFDYFIHTITGQKMSWDATLFSGVFVTFLSWFLRSMMMHKCFLYLTVMEMLVDKIQQQQQQV